MKKISVSIISLLISLVAGAQSVSEQSAADFARRYLGTDEITVVNGRQDKAYSGRADQPCYAFNKDKGGWVVVAGDLRMNPVIGHSDSGEFKWDGMPDNIKAWFSQVQTFYEMLQESDAQQSESIRKAWSGAKVLPKVGAESRKQLSTALWDQGFPYNQACNKAIGKSVYTGCVATAMAIVMRYHRWPEQGTGTIPSYRTESWGYNVPSIDIDGYTYNWDVMPTTDGGSTSWSSTAKTAVSTLIYHCGASVYMDYTSSGSGAYSSDIPVAMAKYFSYDKSAETKVRGSYRNVEGWIERIKTEIDADRPVLYGASGSEGGHQFICDGYDSSTNELHFNWGWGGADNGFFAIDLTEMDLDSGHEAIFGMKPDREGTSSYTDNIALDFLEYTNGEIDGNGIVLTSGTIEKGNTFSIKADCILNYSAQSYKGALKAALVDKDYNLKEFICSEISKDIDYYITPQGYVNYTTFGPASCRITSGTSFGDRIVIYYLDSTTGEWKPIQTNYSEYFFSPYLSVYDVNYIEDRGNYKAGDLYYPVISRGRRQIRSVVWSFDDKVISDIDAGIKLTSGTHTIKAEISLSDGGKETVVKKLSVD